MILRTEKRRLIGREASGIRISGLSSLADVEGLNAFSAVRHVHAERRQNLVANIGDFGVGLLNLFEIACV
jgi:hypothetical protein